MARAILEIVLDSKGNVQAIKQAGKDLEGLEQGGERSASALDGLGRVAAFAGGALAAIEAGKQAIEFVELGAGVEAAETRLAAFAGGTEQANAYLAAFQEAADGTVDRMAAMAGATKLLGMGLVENTDEMGLMAEMAVKLGDQTLAAGDRVNDFALLLANQSVQRLDNFNISSGRVRARIDELLASGQALARDEAFKMAVMEIGAESLAKLGDQSELLTTKLGQVKAAIADAKTGFATLAVEALAGAGGVEDLTARIRGLPMALKQTGILVRSVYQGLEEWRPWDWSAGVDAFTNSMKRGAAAMMEVRHESEVTRYAHLGNTEALEVERDAMSSISFVSDEMKGKLQEQTTSQGMLMHSVLAAQDALAVETAALEASDEVTDRAAQAQLGLAASLKGASEAQIAQAAIGALGQELAEGDITMGQYAEAVGQTQLAFGLADEASVNLSKSLLVLVDSVGEGTVAAEEFDEELGRLIDQHEEEERQLKTFGRLLNATEMDLDAAERATGDLGRALRDLPDEKHVQVVVHYSTSGTPPSEVPPVDVPGGGDGVGGGIPESYAMGAGMGTVAAPMTMSGGSGPSGGGSIVIHNHFGRGSVRSDEDIEDITEAQERIRLLRGVRLWEVA